jgi:hypothetical protein
MHEINEKCVQNIAGKSEWIVTMVPTKSVATLPHQNKLIHFLSYCGQWITAINTHNSYILKGSDDGVNTGDY